MKPGINTANRFDSLDALRGYAAILVIWQHFSESFVKIPGVAEKGTALASIAHAVDFGRIGVIIFFLVSGFIIPTSLKGENKQITLRKFAIRRFYRLYPAYWLSIVLATAIFAATSSHNITTLQLLANLTMIQAYLGEDHILGLYWTLQIELVFYVICAALFLTNKSKNKDALATIILLLAIFTITTLLDKKLQLHTSKEILYTPYLIAIMFVGKLARDTHDSGWANSPEHKRFLIGSIACFSIPAIVLLCGGFQINITENPTRFGASHLIGIAAFILGLKVKPLKFAVKAGTISYSLYLLHPIVMEVTRYAANQLNLIGGQLYQYMAFSFAITVLLSLATYEYIERKFNTYAHRLTP
jgi:peptidoglycan/LPS O-acetylase OafA/YrhL